MPPVKPDLDLAKLLSLITRTNIVALDLLLAQVRESGYYENRYRKLCEVFEKVRRAEAEIHFIHLLTLKASQY